MENIEIWKNVKDYEEFYQVSNLGRVKSLARDVYYQNGTIHRIKEKILAPALNNCGYANVNLCKNGKMKNITVHRLVAEAFLPNPENKSQINHKNEVKTDNVVENLEWCDAFYNVNYGTRTQRQKQTFKDNWKSGKNKRIKKVFCVELNKTYDCAKSAQEELGVNRRSIGYVCRGERNTAGGFHWKFADD